MAFSDEQLSNEFRDFDLRASGAVGLVERWKQQHDDEVRAVWGVEDLVAVYNDVFQRAQHLVTFYQDRGRFPNAQVRFSYFAEATARFLIGAQTVETLIAAAESQGYPVNGAAAFREFVGRFSDLLAEEGVTLRAFGADVNPIKSSGI